MDMMIISAAQYTPNYDAHGNSVGGNIGIIATIDGIEMHVPLDPANRHYAAILEWVAEGNTIQEAD